MTDTNKTRRAGMYRAWRELGLSMPDESGSCGIWRLYWIAQTMPERAIAPLKTRRLTRSVLTQKFSSIARAGIDSRIVNLSVK